MNIQKMKGRAKNSNRVIMPLFRNGLLIALVLMLIFNSTSFIYAEEKWPSVDEIVADSYIVIDQNTGNVILEKNSSKKINPASLTKILTAIIGIENLGLDQTITVSKAAASLSESESTIDLISGEILTFKELLYGMLLSSGNDAAVAIGEKVGGNAASFIALMNKKSKEIGAMNSSWNNPQGITAETHYSTSADLALITRYALQNELFRKVADTPVYSMATTNKHPFSGWNVLENTNKLLRFQNDYFASDRIYEISGVKTGTTTAAGSNLIATAHTKNGLQLICVLNGARGDNSKNVWAYTRTLFEEASKVTDGVQNILTENSAIIPANDPNKWYPAQSFSLFIGKNPELDVIVEKAGDEIQIKAKTDNKILFSTAAKNTINTSEISASDSDSESRPEQNSSSISENASSTYYMITVNKNIILIVLFGIAILIGLSFLIIILKSPKRKNGKNKNYSINRRIK